MGSIYYTERSQGVTPQVAMDLELSGAGSSYTSDSIIG